MTEFDDAPLVAGTVTGVRAFRVDRLGRLRGPQQGTVWRPGVNDCKCRRGVGNIVHYNGGVYTTTATATQIRAMSNVKLRPVVDDQDTAGPGHSLASCKCGWYAYTDAASRDYERDGTVAAVVEGWGDVMLGERGFRAQHARVVAVCLPDREVPDPRLAKLGRVARFWRRHNGGSLEVWAFCCNIVGVVFGIFGLASVLASVPPWVSALLASLAVAFTWLASTLWRAEHSLYGARAFRATTTTAFDPSLAMLVRRNYPDVHVYTDRAAMVAAHPPYRGEEPTPATAGFWELP